MHGRRKLLSPFQHINRRRYRDAAHTDRIRVLLVVFRFRSRDEKQLSFHLGLVPRHRLLGNFNSGNNTIAKQHTPAFSRQPHSRQPHPSTETAACQSAARVYVGEPEKP